MSFLALQSSHWGRESRLLYFFDFGMSCHCYRPLIRPHGAIGWPVVCDCGIFWSNLFNIFEQIMRWINMYCGYQWSILKGLFFCLCLVMHQLVSFFDLQSV